MSKRPKPVKQKPLDVQRLLQSVTEEIQSKWKWMIPPSPMIKVIVRQPYICVELSSGTAELEVYGYGFSRCNPLDPFDRNHGTRLAFSRAVSDYIAAMMRFEPKEPPSVPRTSPNLHPAGSVDELPPVVNKTVTRRKKAPVKKVARKKAKR